MTIYYNSLNACEALRKTTYFLTTTTFRKRREKKDVMINIDVTDEPHRRSKRRHIAYCTDETVLQNNDQGFLNEFFFIIVCDEY